MTCKDCKHFDADNHPKIFGFMSRAGHCDKRVADGYDEYTMPECDACDMFEPKEETIDDAIQILQSSRVIPHVIFSNTEEDAKYNAENRQAIAMAIYALEKLKESVSK